MGSLTIYQDDYEEATIVSNLFIDDYLKDANDAQIKVFLYLLRMMSAHKATSISDIADKFNYPEKDVIRALNYWENNLLLSVQYDDQKYPVGIYLKPIPKPGQTRPINNITLLAEKEAPKKSFPKPAYSLDDLKAFKEAEDTAQIFFIAEQYLGKPLSTSDITSILFFMDTLKFSADMIDYLIQYCVERGKRDFRYIEKVAVSWAEEGIITPKQAAKAARKYDKIVYDVMKALGKQNSPTKIEANMILSWTREFGFDHELIFEACNRTVMAVDRNRLNYCNAILQKWEKNNVRHITDIANADIDHNMNRTAKPAKNNKATMFHQFKQNTYDFEALEREMFSN
ncbi:MAG: DnaD domain protein [Lachnospiraceae bacterium]|nr:DnaD domain protein [Lachnospiraceae bacterium]